MGFHSSNARDASLSMMSGTPCRYMSSWRPDQMMVSPVASSRLPVPVQRVSWIPSKHIP